MVVGNSGKEDYEAFINTTIAPAITEFKVAEHNALVGLFTYKYSVPRGQTSFRIPVIKSSTGLAERLGEYGRATYAKPDLGELEFTVKRIATSMLLTEDAIAAAQTVGMDAITNQVNDAVRRMERTYANDLMVEVMTGWADGTTAAPDYAGRTFAAHDHLIVNTAGGLTLEKIATAKLKVSEHGYLPDTLLLSPEGENDLIILLKDNDTGAPMLPAIVEGSVGRIWGLNVFVTPWVTDKHFIVVASGEKPLVFGEREPMELRSEFDPLERLWDAQIHASYGFGVIKEFAGVDTVYKA